MGKLRKSFIFKPLVWLMAILVLAACNYYRMQPIVPDSVSTINDIGRIYKHFFIHEAEGEIWYLTGIELDSTSVYGSVEYPPAHVSIMSGQGFKPHYRYEAEQKIDLQQIHFYLKEGLALSEGSVAIPFEQLRTVEITQRDVDKSTLTSLGATAGIILGTMVVLTIIALLTKSSCPFVYVDNGEDLVFQGEIYGGAILHNLERDDYLPLPAIKPVDNTYRIRITNELKERQYTNLAHLLTVDHAPGAQVLLDQKGQPHVFAALHSPVEAYGSLGHAHLEALCETDDYTYNFEDPKSNTHGLVLEFEKPKTAKQAQLLLHARNSMWGEYLFGRFGQQFGSFHDTWIERQKRQSTEVRKKMVIEQDFDLSVFVERNGQWELMERIPTVGPLASRDMVVPVSLEGSDLDQVRIKITTGFMFWDLDRAAIDFSEKPELEVQRLFPKTAFNSEKKDYTEALWATDDQYMEQVNIGEQTEIRYASPPLEPEKKRSVFLHSSGYYEHIREYKGLPDMEALLQFRTPGHFHQFSQMEYDRFLNRQPAVAVRP